MRIPQGNWTQTNKGDIFGLIYETQNMSFDKRGIATLSQRAFNISTDATDAGLNTILSIVYFGNNYVVITSGGIFQFNVDGTTITDLNDDGNRPDTTNDSDGEVWGSNLFVTIDNNLSKYNGTSWTNSIEALTSGVPHPMCVFESLPTYKLAIGNGSGVLVSDGAGGTGTALALPGHYEVATLAYRNGYLYVGTRNKNGGEAKVFVWDGKTANANFEAPTGATWIQSLKPYKNTVVGVNTKGELFIVEGSAIKVLANFPVRNNVHLRWPSVPNDPFDGGIMHKSMVTVGDDIYINVDGTLALGYEPRMKSGVWVYSPNVGLYHRHGFTTDLFVQDSGITASNNLITTSATHNLKTGDVIEFSTVSGLSGVNTDIKYYVDVQSATTFYISISRKALANGDYVTISGTATSDAIRYVPNTDRYTNNIAYAGAIAMTTPNEVSQVSWHGPVVWGARIANKDGTNTQALFTTNDSWNVGSITTQKIYTSSIIETWKKVTGFIKGIHVSTEEAILKYKKEDAAGYPTPVYQGVWGSANTIHSVSSTYEQDEWDDIEMGNELTIVDGYGRGYTTHVTNKDDSSSTFVLTVDESIGTAEKPVYFYADNFIKVQSIGSDRQHKGILEWAWSVVKSPWIQLKVELRGFQPEFYGFEIDSGKDK